MKSETPKPARVPKPKKRADSSSDAHLDRGIQAEIGKGLRAMYDDVVQQGVPDRFAKLLAEFEHPKKDDKATGGE